MPRPDLLPPISHPLVAELLLVRPLTLDPAAVTARLAERQIAMTDAPWTLDPAGMHRTFRGGEIRDDRAGRQHVKPRFIKRVLPVSGRLDHPPSPIS